jgi:ATP-dependent Clp protease ATP-binding subunit ClpB
MDTNKLTTKSRDAVSTALRLALTNGNPMPNRPISCTHC